MYLYDQKPNTTFDSSTASVLQQIKMSEYAVLVGRNNCGKTFILKTLTQELGMNASYLGPARYQNFNLLGYYTPNRSRKQARYNDFLNFWRAQQNMDNSPLNLQQAIAELSDAPASLCARLLKHCSERIWKSCRPCQVIRCPKNTFLWEGTIYLIRVRDFG